MAGYQSDSDVDSLNESDAVTSTSLGFVDEPVNDVGTATFRDTRLGGQPIWINPSSKPDFSLVKCRNCLSRMPLLLQAYAPLDGTFYDRVLYIFACKKPSCRRKSGSVRALRAVHRDPELEEKERQKFDDENKNNEKKPAVSSQSTIEEAQLLGDSIFGSKSSDRTEKPASNPFSTSNPFETSDPFSTTVDDLPPLPAAISSKTSQVTTHNPSVEPVDTPKSKLSYADAVKSTLPPPTTNITPTQPSPREPWPKEDLPEYPSFFLYVEAETVDSSRKKDDQNLPTGFSENVIDEDFDESTIHMTNLESAANMDKTFQKFVDRIMHNPEQVVRYERGGAPLLYSDKDGISRIFSSDPPSIPLSPLDNEPRAFELQLMPHSISVLERDEENILDGMEWGTVIVATPIVDTMPQLDENGVGYSEEWVGVQWEELR